MSRIVEQTDNGFIVQTSNGRELEFYTDEFDYSDPLVGDNVAIYRTKEGDARVRFAREDYQEKKPAERMQPRSGITCPHCGSTNVNVTFVQEQKLKNDYGSCLYWLLIGWWWKPLKWFLFFIPSFFAMFFPKKQKLITKNNKTCICQSCGYSWQIR